MPSNSGLADSVDLMVTTAGTYLTIGTSPDHEERPVNWKITGPEGRPHRGLVVGASGAGATTLLTRVATATTRIGIDTWYLDTHYNGTPAADWHPEHVEDLIDALEERFTLHLNEPGAHRLMVIIDDPLALRDYAAGLQVMASAGSGAGIGIVVRTPDLAPRHLPPMLRAITASGQYLRFDHGAYQDPDRRLAAYLPGYTAPARSATRLDRTQACGRGVYGRDGIARRVTVHHP